jgi:hypothetical protein
MFEASKSIFSKRVLKNLNELLITVAKERLIGVNEMCSVLRGKKLFTIIFCAENDWKIAIWPIIKNF